MVSMKTRTERTLFFDFLPLDLGDLGGFKTRFLLYTVPGQVFYNATRKLVLRGVDALIFVADSERGKMDENIDSLNNLKDNLKEYGLRLEDTPWVIQYNKRDLPEVYSIEELENALNPGRVPYFEATAMTGQGVFETFRGVSRIVLQKLSKEVKLGESRVIRRPQAISGAETGALAKPAGADAPTSKARVPDPGKVGTTPIASPSAFSKPAHEPAESRPVSSHPSNSAPFHAESRFEEANAGSRRDPSFEEGDGDMGQKTDSHDGAKWPASKLPEVTPAIGPGPVPSVYADILSRRPAKGGFWGRLLGRNKAEPEPEPTYVSRTPVSLPIGRGTGEPVVIERKLRIPITLGPEEIARGARLRLVLEVQVESSGSESEHKVA
jgi:hypothetical protein